MYCHGLEVMCLNPRWVDHGVHSTYVKVILEQKNIKVTIYASRIQKLIDHYSFSELFVIKISLKSAEQIQRGYISLSVHSIKT